MQEQERLRAEKEKLSGGHADSSETIAAREREIAAVSYTHLDVYKRQMLSSIIFILFIFVMVSLISEAGVLDAILVWMRKYAKSEKSAEIAAGAMVSVMGIVISSGTCLLYTSRCV